MSAASRLVSTRFGPGLKRREDERHLIHSPLPVWETDRGEERRHECRRGTQEYALHKPINASISAFFAALGLCVLLRYAQAEGKITIEIKREKEPQ